MCDCKLQRLQHEQSAETWFYGYDTETKLHFGQHKEVTGSQMWKMSEVGGNDVVEGEKMCGCCHVGQVASHLSPGH